MDPIIIATASAFSEKYQNDKEPLFPGNLCFWGQWFERSGNDLYKLTEINFDAANVLLTFTFSGQEVLAITNPGIIEEHANRLEIKTADRVHFEFHDNSGNKSIKIFHFDFTRVDKKIIGKTNIHWATINLKELSIHKPAVILKW
ncbi:MAG: hypothetical protein ABIN36_10850 [Ferruginibacter sp.]